MQLKNNKEKKGIINVNTNFKKFFCIILACLMCFTIIVPIASAESLSAEPVTVEYMESAMQRISDAASAIKELEYAAGISSAFDDFMKTVGYASTALTAINGSVNFLKLIGVIEDPVSGGINNILTQMTAVNDKLADMDNKLNSLSNQMTQMQASEEFHFRGTKALSLNEVWRDFEYRYMESGMDKYMSEFEGYLSAGVKEWCLNKKEESRQLADIDNEQIILVYTPNSDGVPMLQYSIKNSVPGNLPEGSSYVIIKSACLPENFEFTADKYTENLKNDFAKRITDALNNENYDYFESNNFPIFTKAGAASVTTEKINAVAADAANVLVYRIGAAQIALHSAFAEEATRSFDNYCLHLLTVNDGVDSVLKNQYLTHAFEFEIKEELTSFLNRMMLKTGIYGTFITNILGMSDTVTDSRKLQATSTFCKSTEGLEQIKNNCLTGKDRYCYLVNAELKYTQASVSQKTLIHTERINRDRENYKYYNAGKITVSAIGLGDEKYTLPGDVNALLIIETLQNNGSFNDMSIFEYFNSKLGKGLVGGYYDCLLTSYGTEENLPLDGSVLMKPYNIIGNDFNGLSSFKLTSNEKNYPDDADPDYIVYHKKLCGSVYNMKTRKLITNSVLLATAIYGQTHSYWFKDEAAFFAGPFDQTNVISNVFSSNNGKYDYDDTLVNTHWYNILACVPLPPSLHGGKYDPIAAFNDYNIQIKEEYEKNNPQKGPTSQQNNPTSQQNNPTSQQNAPTSPATGDDRNVTFWLSLVLLCGAFVVVLKKIKPYSNK